MADDLDDFAPDAIDAAVRGKPAPKYTGAFVGDPAAVQDAIAGMKDPTERANAQKAFAEQAARTPGFAKGAAFGGSSQPDPLADFNPEAVHAAVTGATAPAKAPAKPSQQITSPEMDLTAHIASGLGSSVVGGVAGTGRFLWELAKTRDVEHAADAAANVVRQVQEAGTYQPRTAQGQQMVEQFGSKLNPLNWPAVVGEKAGNALADAGLPGAGALVDAGIQVGVPMGIKPVARAGVTRLADIGKPSVATAPRVEPTLAPQNAPQLTAQDGTVIQPQMPPAPVRAGGQRVAAPQATAQPTAQPAPFRAPAPPTANPEEAFPTIEPRDAPITDAAERLRRAQVLRSVGINTTRESALSGDRQGGNTDFYFSKVDSPGGKLMGNVIENEKAALQQHAEQLVHDTGGTLDKDQTTAYQRGDSIVAPLKQLETYYDDKARSLYDAANERAKGQPVTLEGFRSTLADDSEMTSPEFVQFRDAAKAFAKKNGMLQDDGSISGTALQAETMRKWLNQKRSYGNAPFVDGLKRSLDGDVMSSAGEDLYTQARALWQQRMNTLDNPSGIAKLAREEGPDGINRAIPYEQVAPKLAKMPVDQFGHIVGTLKNAPPEVQPAATAALNEIRAHFANEIRSIGGSQKGQWAADKVTKYLQGNAARMNQVFTPQEMAKFQNLSEAGQIVAKDQSYAGAAVQTENLGKSGMIPTVVPHVAQGLGALVGHAAGPVGAAAGGFIGRAAGGKIAAGLEGKSSLKAAQGRTVRLSDLLETGK